jgi:uncharacterized membrane protein YoaK (UPF0700 family)
MLSFIAGIVNVTGVLSIKTLTTNVTGHFAFFAEELINQHYPIALIFLLYIFFFLSGAFLSSLLVEMMTRRKAAAAHSIPMLIEIILLTSVGGFYSNALPFGFASQVIACLLLFAMGIQNSLVTKISGSVVRTTHLTGLFTDMGIELSQLMFSDEKKESIRLKRSIFLRITIISFFFTGCVLGGYCFSKYGMKTLWIAAFCLVAALYYDGLRYGFYRIRRKLRG